jgi:type III pantothenate kinase
LIETANTAYADIGNSRIKIFDGVNYLSVSYEKNSLHEVISFIKNQKISKIIYSSVNSEFEKILHLKLNKITELINISDFILAQKIIDFKEVTGMGTDRKLSLFGGLSIAHPPLITIDCGTAITINVLNQDNFCIGGLIFPGLSLQERALKEMTSGLKNFELQIPNQILGKTTSEAISIGLYQGISNAISCFVDSIKKEYFPDKEINIFLTGGSAGLILPILKSKIRFTYEEKLNLMGIVYLIKNQV